jgi:endonuclease/exonuclease/phosphatase (EEP) superfamily protein YafD
MERTFFWLVAAGLGIPALMLTVVRLVDSDVGTMIRVESFTPLGIPLYAALLLLMAFGVMRRPAGQRTQRVVGTFVALAGLVLHGWWFAPQVVGDNPAPAAGAPRITVMTANLFAGLGDAGDVVEAVRRDHVDILVLEETTPIAVDRLDAAGLAQRLPHRIGSLDGDVAGTMVFSNERMGEPALLDTSLFHSYRVQVGTLTLLAVHPVSPVLSQAWRRDHDLIRREAVDKDADLIVGDLNATSDHDVLRELEDAGFRDAGELANEGWQPTWPANDVGPFPRLPPLVRIDHVLVAPTLASLGTHTVDIRGSDHLALVATVARR